MENATHLIACISFVMDYREAAGNTDINFLDSKLFASFCELMDGDLRGLMTQVNMCIKKKLT